jgi:rRNA maturation protein Nop10
MMPLNARGIPTSECPTCGGNIFKILAMFDNETYEISQYLLDAECDQCGTLVTAPTPIDMEV